MAAEPSPPGVLAALGAAAEAPTDAAGGGVIAPAAGGAAAAAGGSAGAGAAGAGAPPAAGAATKAGGGARPAGGASAGAACSGATIGPALHESVAQLAGPAHWAGLWYRLRARRMRWHRPAPAAAASCGPPQLGPWAGGRRPGPRRHDRAAQGSCRELPPRLMPLDHNTAHRPSAQAKAPLHGVADPPGASVGPLAAASGSIPPAAGCHEHMSAGGAARCSGRPGSPPSPFWPQSPLGRGAEGSWPLAGGPRAGGRLDAEDARPGCVLSVGRAKGGPNKQARRV